MKFPPSTTMEKTMKTIILTILTILTILLALVACDDGGVVGQTPVQDTRCDEELAQQTAIYCAGFTFCGRAVNPQPDTTMMCAVNGLETAKLVIEHAEDRGACATGLLDYYACTNRLSCEAFDAMLEAVTLKQPHECQVERAAASIHCDHDLLTGP